MDFLNLMEGYSFDFKTCVFHLFAFLVCLFEKLVRTVPLRLTRSHKVDDLVGYMSTL